MTPYQEIQSEIIESAVEVVKCRSTLKHAEERLTRAIEAKWNWELENSRKLS